MNGEFKRAAVGHSTFIVKTALGAILAFLGIFMTLSSLGFQAPWAMKVDQAVLAAKIVENEKTIALQQKDIDHVAQALAAVATSLEKIDGKVELLGQHQYEHTWRRAKRRMDIE